MTRGNGSLIFEKPIFALILSHGTEGDKEEQGLSTTVTMDFTGELLHVKVAPRQPYSPPALKIASRYGDVELLLEEEQLAEIGYAIQQYLEAIRYHETPDQQLILNHEYEEEAANEAH